ncbi:class I SAM-dependent methyltransferase [Rhizobium sp. CNPSo 4062]|uniref:class I SAM-dependent methyltransferase n=1 Tax=Rhizobium sp. CNPSo 4062 TaxID=3021410 RepID=UPI000DDCF592
MICSICGCGEFVPGFQGRVTNGINPLCNSCKSAERHRIAFALYSAVHPLFKSWRALQFAPDRCVMTDWFAEYVGSSYQGVNHLDMTDIALPDGAFDIVISNHVLEHVDDDMKAIREMLRVVGPKGIVSMMIPTPIMRWQTTDWGFADPKINYHYRDYGADFPQIVVDTISDVRAVVAIGRDPVTGIFDLVYLFSKSDERLEQLAQIWRRTPVPLVRLFK